jgi:hypothetical protein
MVIISNIVGVYYVLMRGFQIMTLRTCLRKQAGVDKVSACAGINAAPLFLFPVSTEGGEWFSCKNRRIYGPVLEQGHDERSSY